VRSAAIASWRRSEPRERAEASLLAADKAFAADMATRGASAAFQSVMHASSRLYRNGLLPMTRDAAVEWLAREVVAMSSEPMKVESAQSGDLGYTWGKYTAKGSTASTSSYYIRVWGRKQDGSWQLISDITTPPAPPGR
jgi:ketosteroid isomerase-like protein